MRDCLTCKYEPYWPEPSGGSYPRSAAACRWDGVIPVLPKPWMIDRRVIVRHMDNSGIPHNCAAWVAKPE